MGLGTSLRLSAPGELPLPLKLRRWSTLIIAGARQTAEETSELVRLILIKGDP